MPRRQSRKFRGFGLGIMRRIRGPHPTPLEAEPVILACKRLIGGGIFFDVGANIGEVSEALLPFASKVVAMEPDPDASAQLKARLGDRAVCVQALIGPEGAERVFLSNSIESTGSTSVAPGDEPEGHDYLKRLTMTSVSLDTMARRYGMPSVVKLDVEGFEMSVLDSAREILAHRPAVIMEFNALCLSYFGRVNPRDALDRICSMFPRVQRIGPDGLEPLNDRYAFLSEHILQNSSVDNLVCTWS